MIIMGVDPGLRATGYGIVELNSSGVRLVEGGIIRTSSSEPLSRRLAVIHNDICGIIENCKPSAMVVEDLYTDYSHPQTAVLMGHARGVVFLGAASFSVPLHIYTATLVKRALTGNGRAAKTQVGRMVANLLHLAAMPKPDHVTDALALALCHINTLNGGYGI